MTGFDGVEESVWKQRWLLAKDLWSLPKYRAMYFRTKRREMKMFWKYDSHIYIQKFGLVALGLATIVFVASRKTGALLLRLPTEDVNELLKHDAWVEERNQINLRKEQANKLLNDSNYISARNSPVK